jgi:adenylate cyclase
MLRWSQTISSIQGAVLPNERVERRLAAVLAADVAGYSRLMGRDEERTLAELKSLRKMLLDPTITAHRGRIVKTTGDGMLVEFASVVDAARSALAIQQEVKKQNDRKLPELRIQFRIRIHVGDIIVDDNDIFGDGVNIAARLEGIAEPGGVCISDDAHRQIRGKVDVTFDDMGEQTLKNIVEPMRTWQLRLAGQAAPAIRPSSPPTPDLKLPDKPSIVVLPFGNMSAEAGQDYLADGIVEAITAALSCIRSFFVISRSSAFTYKGRVTNARDIGKELGVAYLLEGSLQKIDNRLRIIVQLVETEGGAHVWSSRFDGAIDDFFDLEDRITQQVAGALQPSIRIAEIERSRRKRPQDLSCYVIDPEYPLALVLAGWCHAQRAVYTWVDDIVGSQAIARSLAERAADLSGDDPLVLAVLGAVHTFVRNHGTARVLLERAVSLDPNCAWAWSRLGWIENYGGQPDKAIENFERALRLSPIDPMNFNNYVGIGSAHEILEEYDEAAALYRRALVERPNAVWIYRALASVLSGAGRIEEAKKALVEVLRNYPDLTISKVRQAMVFSDTALDRIAENLRRLGLPD